MSRKERLARKNTGGWKTDTHRIIRSQRLWEKATRKCQGGGKFWGFAKIINASFLQKYKNGGSKLEST